MSANFRKYYASPGLGSRFGFAIGFCVGWLLLGQVSFESPAVERTCKCQNHERQSGAAKQKTERQADCKDFHKIIHITRTEIV